MLKMDKTEGIYLACGATDMRKSINGLCGIVQSNFKLDPFSKMYFVFCNRQRNRIKILTWEENGFWLHFKRLEQGRFAWPDDSEESTMSFSFEELMMLINSVAVKQKVMRKTLFCDRKMNCTLCQGQKQF